MLRTHPVMPITPCTGQRAADLKTRQRGKESSLALHANRQRASTVHAARTSGVCMRAARASSRHALRSRASRSSPDTPSPVPQHVTLWSTTVADDRWAPWLRVLPMQQQRQWREYRTTHLRDAPATARSHTQSNGHNCFLTPMPLLYGSPRKLLPFSAAACQLLRPH